MALIAFDYGGIIASELALTVLVVLWVWMIKEWGLNKISIDAPR
jgi:hypothetical protein